MLLIETAKTKTIAKRAAPRNVFCVIENKYQSLETADNATRGIFTNAGLTLDLGRKINFAENPLPSDEEWQIEWFKFYFGLDLAHTFHRTNDAKYLQTFEYLVRSFVKQIPIGFDTADVTARRIQNWIYARQKFAESPAFYGFSVGFETEFIHGIKTLIAFIEANLTPERNHRTLELYALFIAALALPEIDDGGNLLKFALEKLHENLLTDIQPDGVQREQSSDYHLIVLRSFLGVKKNAQVFGLPLADSFDEKILKACEFALHIHRPDGKIPALSDGDTGSFLDLLQLAAELYGRKDFLYAATKGEKGTAPPKQNVSFSASGYHIQRSGWGDNATKFEDENFLVFDCGPLGDGGHGHYDLLSVEIAANGKPLVVDTGRYTYSEEGAVNWRHFFKGTKAHNTVCIDEKDQTAYRRGKPKKLIANGELIERIALENLDILCGKVVSPMYDAMHTRRIFLIENKFWIIYDELESDVPHRYDLRFHLTPETWNHFLLTENASNKIVRTNDLALVFEKEKNPIIEPSWYSPGYGIKHRIPCVSVVEKAVKSTSFFTLVYPLKQVEMTPAFEIFSSNAVTKIEIRRGNEVSKLSWKITAEKLTEINFETSEVTR
jgi:Heparinase II/III-like protein/Heparinase II/III N-terminus